MLMESVYSVKTNISWHQLLDGGLRVASWLGSWNLAWAPLMVFLPNGRAVQFGPLRYTYS